MHTLDPYFRHKSLRRSRRRSRDRALKTGALVVFFGSLAAAAFLLVAGLPR
jgi:hypothetical protein